jgi:hypothetical protein
VEGGEKRGKEERERQVGCRGPEEEAAEQVSEVME